MRAQKRAASRVWGWRHMLYVEIHTYYFFFYLLHIDIPDTKITEIFVDLPNLDSDELNPVTYGYYVNCNHRRRWKDECVERYYG
jgi:hypothetical protein